MATEKIEDKAVVGGALEKSDFSGNIDLEKKKQKVEQGGEQKIEKSPESVENKHQKAKTEENIKNEAENSAVVASQAQVYYQARAKAIDDILSAGLHEVFLQMNPAKQKEFKQVGEETVVKIVSLLDKTKVRVDKIISLIRNWLKIIPGVNKFFLEQEAKIKADRIIKLKK